MDKCLLFTRQILLVILLLTSFIEESKVSSSKSDGQPCKCGWIYHGNHCYYFSKKTLDWYDAAAYCRNLNGYLIKVNDKKENDYIKTYVAYLSRYNKKLAIRGSWIGGHDFTEGKWYWDADNSKLTFQDFSVGQPNSQTSRDDCLHLAGVSTKFKWNDNNCDISMHFICEKSLNTDPCVCHAK